MSIFHILFLTWNVGHQSYINFSHPFVKIKRNHSDLLIINLQEIDKRSHILNGQCTKSMNKFRILIDKEFSEYKIIHSLNFQSVALFILKNNQFDLNLITNESFKVKKHDADGKSSIIYSFSLNQRKISIIGNHFQFDAQNFCERNLEWLNVVADLLERKDYILMLGDLNYRIEMSRDKVIKRISEKNFQRLLRSDQLKRAQKIFPVLGIFKEPLIRFPPTYKFDLNSNEYDSSPKKRVPSYTDRILVASLGNNREPNPIEYNSIDSLQSDHRPVYAYYEFFL